MRSLGSVIVVVAAILVSACGPMGKKAAEDERRNMENSQFAELMTRPDIETVAKRYEDMRMKIRDTLVADKFVVSWQERSDSSGGVLGCNRSFPEVDSSTARVWALKRWTSEGNLPDDKWERAVAAVAEIGREYGFGEPKVVVNRPSDHEVSFRDGYGGEMLFGTAKNTILALTTGCHLTVAAHQRGTPTPRPTY
jgi:hypothetical protein